MKKCVASIKQPKQKWMNWNVSLKVSSFIITEQGIVIKIPSFIPQGRMHEVVISTHPYTRRQRDGEENVCFEGDIS